MRALGLCVVTALCVLGCEESRSAPPPPPVDPATQDKAALEELRQAGVGADAGVRVGHHLYFANEEQANRAALAATAAGYEARTTRHPGVKQGKEWLLVARKVEVPSLDSLAQARKELGAIAAQEAGEYDGWQVVLR